jgi:TonB-linked SusC/RagA family outer membrane protein
MKKLLRISLFLLAILSGTWAVAQDRTVTGKVTTADDGSALAGVSVSIKGSTRGTNTDAEGNYRLSVPDNATLVFSFVGMNRQEVVVGNRSVVDLALQTDIAALEEVVVVGYGTAIKRDLTGNIASVKGTEIQNLPVATVESAIAGRAAGVFVTQGNGKLGQGIQVRVRGSSSVSASNQPLYVIDGIPITTANLSSVTGATNPLADLNFNDVESVEVLKDASAAAIYGSRAANGVVLITTKKGKSGRTNVSFNYQVGSSQPTRLREYMNADEWVQHFRTAAANSDALDPASGGFYTSFLESRLERYRAGTTLGSVSTDWQAQAFQDAPMQQADLTLNGGNEKTKFYISGQYFDQKGILVRNSLERFSGRVNLDHKATDWLTVGLNFSLARSYNRRLSNDNAFSTPMQIVALSPITPLIDPRSGLLSGTPPGASTNYPIYYNPLISVDNSKYNTTVFRNITNGYLQLDLLKGLIFRSELGVDVLSQNEDAYYGSATVRNTGTANGEGLSAFALVTNYNTNNYFNYNRVFGVHAIGATVGMSFQQSKSDFNNVVGQQFPSDAYQRIASAADITGGSSSQTNFTFLSYFARANYRFNDRYLLEVSGRVDGSSRFGNNSKYGFFPAVSAGWVLSEESFLKNSRTLSFLKLRASYGITGNAEVGNFPSLGLFGQAGYAGVAGQAPTQLANPDLRWETTTQTDIGLDYGLINNRLNGEIDYYTKNTTDLLLGVNVPATTGFLTQVRNVGRLENKGFEFTLNSQNLVGKFQWTTSLNFAANRNKILDLQGQIIEGGVDNANRAVEGQPLGVFFLREFAGADPANGDALYYTNAEAGDRSTTNDFNAAERVIVGNPNPKWIGGITNTFSFAGFELNFLFQAVQGNDAYLGGGKFELASGDFLDNQLRSELNAWTPTNTNTDVPQARLLFANGTGASSRYITDASYVRLRTATLGYTFPKSITSKIKLERLRLYVTGVNLLTFTKYKGWDPEVNTDSVGGNIALGNDFYSAPQARTITFGLNIGL